MRTRIFAALLALIMAFGGTVTGCAKTSSEGAVNTAGQSDSDEISEILTGTEAAVKAPDLPQVDMGGKEFTILTQRWYDYAPLDMNDIAIEEQTGEILNDAAFIRQSAVSEKYNCTIKCHEVIATGGAGGVDEITSSVMAGENAYDFAVIRSVKYNSLITSGYLMDLSDIPYLELEREYYAQQSYSALSICGNHYGIVSNITMNPYLLIFCTYFNKALFEDYNFDNPYDMVRDGSWTIDTVYDLGKIASSDLNGDGKHDAHDRYGISIVNDVYEGLINSSGVTIAVSNGDTFEKLYNSEAAITKMQHICDIFKDKEATFNIHSRENELKDAGLDEVKLFKQRGSLFSMAGIYYAPQFRDMDDDFGILPMPKYDEAQEEYISPVFCDVFPITVVPVTNDNLEYTGIIMEELSYRGYTELLPVFYDTILTGKCVRDDDSVEILEMIFSGASYDIGMIFNFGGVRTQIRNLCLQGSDRFASTFASIDNKVDQNIEDLINAVNEIE